MLQVATFLLPKEEAKANQFLATHKVSSTNFNKDMIVVFTDDGMVSVGQEIADLSEYITSMKTAQFQQEVAMSVMQADLKLHKAGSNQWQEINSAILNTERGIETQNRKIAFVEKRIKELSKKSK